MPRRGKTFHFVCIICCDNNPDGVSTGQDILLSEQTAHLLHAKREEVLRAKVSIQQDTLPKASSSTPPMPSTLQEDCYFNSSVSSLPSIPSPLHYAAHTDKREKHHLTKKAHATFNVVEHHTM